MRHKTFASYSFYFQLTAILIQCLLSFPTFASTLGDPDAETLFPDTKLDKERGWQSGGDGKLSNSTERIVNDKLSGETASLLFNDGYLNGGLDCGGVCVHASTCNRLGGTVRGFCSRNGGLCCMFDRTCSQVSKELVSFFHSPGYPAPVVGTLICQHDVVILPGVCGIRLEFKEFNTTRPLDRGICNIDQFLILKSIDGPAFPRCGELTGYATIIHVDPTYNQPLTLLSIIQSNRETFKWNIKVTQMKCGSYRPIRDFPNCGRKSVGDQSPVFPDSGENDNAITSPEKLQKQRTSEELQSAFVDNAFYIEYLKQTHQAMYDGPSPNPNQTLCKNTIIDVLKEKISNNSTNKISSRIIRGQPAELNEYPWQISIQDKKGHVCGGAILNEYSILTASHCFMSVAPVLLRQIKIIVGDLNLNMTTEADHEELEIHSVLFHSHFDPYYLQNDIAVIRVRRPIQFRRGVQPVCLPEEGNSYANREAWISGWGAVSAPFGKLATHLQKVSNNIIENSECKKTLKIEYIFSTMVCAVAPRCAGTCFGDSGGPLVVEHNNVSRVVGIVSFGIGGCALLPFWPDVYTRVTEYLPWLSYATSWN
ncbi:unnamed protein product [Allacma fusca]|uniref:limulus clotting factor C n=1 Tax=Allacma fusca TaxID=39272 RepID=A0A8J2NXH8_9HEXA|nr:unnamed protein product [Allacma fusca]